VPELFLVVNKVAPGTDLAALREQIGRLFGADVEALMPLSTEMVRLGSHDLFCNRYPDHPLTQELGKIVARLRR
jgi:hypothetical protein